MQTATQQTPYILLFQLAGTILARRALGNQPIFPLEFVMEDLLLLLALVCCVVPARFEPLIRHVIQSLMGIIFVWIVGAVGSPRCSWAQTVG